MSPAEELETMMQSDNCQISHQLKPMLTKSPTKITLSDPICQFFTAFFLKKAQLYLFYTINSLNLS
ncbi:hypothetical protein EEL33_17640 [Muribaculaceae bacterium Isolate-037 (Harlan)]|nr:hypothetical protein EEL33_17640 [Muribaculaceae bacterium Isolate-037 (Harlan)]